MLQEIEKANPNASLTANFIQELGGVKLHNMQPLEEIIAISNIGHLDWADFFNIGKMKSLDRDHAISVEIPDSDIGILRMKVVSFNVVHFNLIEFRSAGWNKFSFQNGQVYGYKVTPQIFDKSLRILGDMFSNHSRFNGIEMNLADSQNRYKAIYIE